MILNIAGNLALVEQEDSAFKPHLLYKVQCTDQHDANILLKSVFQIRYDNGYKMLAKVNEFIDSDVFFIDTKMKKDFLIKWLELSDDFKGFFLSKEYYLNNNFTSFKKEEKFIHTQLDYFNGVKTAIQYIRLRNLFTF